MTRQVSLGFVVIALALLGLVLAQGMMGGVQPYPFGRGQGMMGPGYGYGPGMMGGMGMMAGMPPLQVYPANATPISQQEAEARLQAFAERFGARVKLRDVMAFSHNYYAQLVDETGQGIGEVLVDRYTGLVTPEMGPNMMWNTRAGMMGMALGGEPRYDTAAARELAETFLKGFLPDATIHAGQAFSGYTTFDFGREVVEGMLSVNTYTGEIWVHSWHGPYIGGHD